MNEKNKFIVDLNSLIKLYLSQKDIDEYTSTILNTLHPKLSSDCSSDELFDYYFKESILSEKVRLLTDTLITFVEKKLSLKKYVDFLLPFGKLLLTQGEHDIANDIANIILKISAAETGMENQRGEALLLIAEFHIKQADWKVAVTNIKKARDIFEVTNKKDGLGQCEFLIGSMYVEKGDLKAGFIRLHNCLMYSGDSKNPLLTGMVEVNLGIISYIEGNMVKALELYEKALAKFKKLGDTRREAEVMQNIGMIFRNNKDYNSALKIYNDCLEISKQFGYQPITNLCYMNIAEIQLEKGDLAKAFNFAQKSLVLSYQLNDKLTLADIHKMLGVLSLKERNYASAENFLLTSLRLNNDLNQELNCAETNYQLGLLYKEKGNKKDAYNHLMNAFKFYHKNHSKPLLAEIESHLSSLNN